MSHENPQNCFFFPKNLIVEKAINVENLFKKVELGN